MLLKSDVDFVQLITKAGYSIVVIDDRFYTTKEFVPSTIRDNFHTLVGLDITEIRDQLLATTHSHLLDVQLKNLIESIDKKSIPVRVDFSSTYKFMWFKPVS